MANADTLLVSVKTNLKVRTGGESVRTTQNSQLTQKSGGEKFSATLDKASAQINQQAQPEQPAAEIQPVKADANSNLNNAAVSATPQGLNEKPQDAPQILSVTPTAIISEIIPQSAAEIQSPENFSQPTVELPVQENFSQPTVEVPVQENFSHPAVETPAPENFSQPAVEVPAPENFSQPAVEVPTPENFSQPAVETPAPEISARPKVENDAAPENAYVAPAQPVLVSANYFFTPNTEVLLDTQSPATSAAVNLMTVVPQVEDSNSQSMLNLLSGKTWSAADVQASVSPQVQPAVENISAPVQTSPELPATPLEISVPTESNQQINPQPQVSAQAQTQPTPIIFARFQPQQNFTPTAQPVENLNSAAPQVEIQPQVQPVQTQPAVEIPATPQIQTPAAAVTQSVEISAAPQVQVTAQQQAQQISDTPSLNVTLEEAPASTPVIPVQQAPTQQQFSQPQQQTFAQSQPQTPAQTLTPPAAQVSSEEIPVAQPQVQAQPVQPQISQPVEVSAPTQNFTPPVAQVPNAEVEVPTAQPQVQAQTQPVQISAEENSAAQVSDSPTPVLTASNANNIQQPLAQVQTPDATAQAPREDFNVPAQIVQQARLIRTAENTEMVINLKPEHLGQLTLRISVSQNGAVNASFFSDNVQVRTIIENSLVQLRQELNEQGLKVENVQVYSGLSDGGLTNGQGQQAWQQNQQQNSGGGRINLSAFEEEVDALNPAGGTVSTDGVDYKI